jgi:protein gp37
MKLALEKWGDWRLPVPNIWLGTTAENQEQANIRIPKLLEIPAAIHWVSFEPLLGPIDIRQAAYQQAQDRQRTMNQTFAQAVRIDWAICGAESGPGARSMDLGWALGLKLQCVESGIPFFMKQICQGGKKIPYEQFPANLQVREMPRDDILCRCEPMPEVK